MVRALGHVVRKVRDLERSAAFYRDVLGLREVARYHPGPMTFFVVEGSGNHHDFALAEVGAAAPAPDEAAVGLAHVAFKVGDHLDALRAARERLRRHGVRLLGQSDHGVSQSVYVADPDHQVLGCCVEADPALWHAHPDAVATIRPLRL